MIEVSLQRSSRHESTRAVLAVCALVVSLALSGTSRSQTYDEYAIKAALLYNFSKFVSWPDEASLTTRDFEICVYGRDPYGDTIDAVSERTTKGRSISIVRHGRLTDGDCHIAFIGQSETYRVEEAIAFFRDKPVLTIAETPDFVEKGGMIGLLNQQNRVSFEINLSAARTAELNLSSQLLRIAERIVDQE